MLMALLALIAGIAAGCGDSSTEDACAKNPWLCYSGIYFYPEDGQDNIAYDGTTFSMVFPKSIDPDTYSAMTGFSITIEKTSTGNTFTVNQTNDSDYGTYALSTTNNTNDTLSFTLYSNSVLTGNGLNTLESDTTYRITVNAFPTNLRYTDGSYPDYSYVQTTGTFRTL